MSVHEFDGKKYRKASKHQKEWGLKIISEFNFRGNESILDLGCGDGILTRQLSGLVPDGKTVGIDASEGMIKAAKELETDRLSFMKLNIDSINFTGEFDLIFSNATLHWVRDHKKLLANCHRALKENGIIRFNFAGDGNCSNFYEVIKEVMGNKNYKKYFLSFEWPWFMPAVEEYKSLVVSSDFKDIEVWDENADRYFVNKDEIAKWIDQPSIVPFLKLIDDEDKEVFRNEVVRRMIDKTEKPDGRCFETFRRINVRAVKK
jgi:trans-aconitate 2-methyltransferase